MFYSTILSIVFVLCSLIGSFAIPIDGPKLSLSFAAVINATGIGNIVTADKARAKHLLEQGLAMAKNTGGPAGTRAKRASSFSVTNVAVVYVANVGVGTPPTSYSLLIDTGSSNTWVGAGKAYVRTSSSHDTGQTVSVSYGSGFFSGEEFTDTVTLDSALVITGQGVGVASSSSGFSGFDGVLGIGPVDLTQGTTSGGGLVPTVSDNLLSQSKITTEVVGVFFAPTTTTSNPNGELTFGGTDSTKITSGITYTSITTTSPASFYWGINESITYGTTTILSTTAGIVDTGTTLILIATDAFNRYKSATGAVLDFATGLLKVTNTQFNALKNLNFVIGGVTFSLTPNGQIWPRSLNTFIGGTTSGIYLITNDIGSPSGQGLDFIDGYTFLERFYSVFDTTSHRVGFATTAFTTATTN